MSALMEPSLTKKFTLKYVLFKSVLGHDVSIFNHIHFLPLNDFKYMYKFKYKYKFLTAILFK